MGRNIAVIACVLALLSLVLPAVVVGDQPTRAPTALDLISPALDDDLTGSLVVSVQGDDTFDSILFYTSPDGSTWTELGEMTWIDPTWDVTLDVAGFADGDLYLKANGTYDTDRHLEAVWGPFTVFNPRPPALTWIYPEGDEDPLRDIYFHIGVDQLDGDVVSFDIWYSLDGVEWAYLDDHTDEYDENIGWVEGDTFSTSFDWEPFELPDDEYYFRANLTTTYGMVSESVIGPIPVDHDHPPSLAYVAPAVNSTLSGSVAVEVDFFDLDDDIGNAGVEFFYRMKGEIAFIMIGNDPDGSGRTYSILWDTTTVLNGHYDLRAEAADLSDPPRRGGVQWDVGVDNGFEPSGLDVVDQTGDEVTLRLEFPARPIGLPLMVSVSMGLPDASREMGDLSFDSFSSTFPDKYVDLTLSLAGFPMGNMTVEVHVVDSTGMSGGITVADLFYHSPVQIPLVEVLSPDEMVVKGNVSLRARVIDDDVPLIDNPSFYYSKDNSTWELIGKGILVDLKVYEVKWDTGLVENWTDYHVKVEYLDSDSLLGVGYLSGIEVRNPPPPPPPEEEEEQMWYEDSSNIIKLAVAALVIGAIVGILIAATARGTRRRRRSIEARLKKDEEKRLGTGAVRTRREVEMIKDQQRKESSASAPSPPKTVERSDPRQGVAVGGAPVAEGGQRPKLTEYEVPEDESGAPDHTLPDS